MSTALCPRQTDGQFRQCKAFRTLQQMLRAFVNPSTASTVLGRILASS